MAQFYSALTIVIHLYTTASLRIGADSPRCTCHFSLPSSSATVSNTKKQKERRNCLPDRYVPWPTNSKGTGKGSGFHTGEELLSRLQGRLGRAGKVSRHHLLIPGEGGLGKKPIPRKEERPPPEPGLQKGEMSWEVSVSWHLLVAEKEGGRAWGKDGKEEKLGR